MGNLNQTKVYRNEQYQHYLDTLAWYEREKLSECTNLARLSSVRSAIDAAKNDLVESLPDLIKILSPFIEEAKIQSVGQGGPGYLTVDDWKSLAALEEQET